MAIAPLHKYCFDSADNHADWKERLGYLFLRPSYSLEGYCKVTLEPSKKCEEVAQTAHSVALRFFLHFLNFLGAGKIGQALLNCSVSHKACCTSFFQKTTPPAQPEELESVTSKGFDEAAKQLSFLDGVLEVYEKWIQTSDMGLPMAKFLQSELSSMDAEVRALVAQRSRIQDLQTAKLASSNVEVEDLAQIRSLHASIGQFTKRYNRALSQVVAKLKKSETEQISVSGLPNVGNTCYINSALQPLLAIPNFEEWVPKAEALLPYDFESDHSYDHRKAILASFRSFLDAKKESKNPQELGRLIGELRKTIFKAGLHQGGFVNRSGEGRFQDAGSFFELMLYVIGQTFKLRVNRDFKLPGGAVVSVATQETPEGVLILKTKEGAVQDKINQYGKGTPEILSADNAYMHRLSNGNALQLTDCTEENKILGAPPNLLIFRVEHYLVNPKQDAKIDCTVLFDPQPDSAKYQLVGFAQNHAQVHWTSVVWDGEAWNYCDDSQVTPANHLHFSIPANYLVYRKV
jgi:hypothetical protein